MSLNEIFLLNVHFGLIWQSDYIITPKWSATPLPVSAVNHADSMSASRAQVPCGLLLSSASIRALGNVRVSGGRQEATLGDAISRTQTPDTLANAHTHTPL